MCTYATDTVPVTGSGKCNEFISCHLTPVALAHSATHCVFTDESF